MKIWFLRLYTFILFGGKKKFLKFLNEELEANEKLRTKIISERNQLSEERRLDADTNFALNALQEAFENKIYKIRWVIENES